MEPTIRLIEDLMEELADQQRILGERQRKIIDAQHERNEKLARISHGSWTIRLHGLRTDSSWSLKIV